MRQLRDLDLGPVKTAGDAWGALMDDLETGQHTTDRQIMTPLHGEWKGQDADAAFRRLTRLSQNFEYGMAESGDVRTLLASVSAELGVQQKALRQALAQAAELGFHVADDGRVAYPASPPMAHGGTAAPTGGSIRLGVAADNATRAQAIADQIRRAVSEATAIDEKYAAALERLRTSADLQVTAKNWADAWGTGRLVAGLADGGLRLQIPDGGDPKKNAAWWRSLTPERRQAYIAAHPDRIGALDGLPADVRDQANRLVLHENRGAVQQRLAAMPPAPERFLGTPAGLATNPLYQIWKDEHDKLTAQLKGMDAIQSRLDSAGREGLPDAYILGFDLNGNGHAVVANGNPDTARHTAVYVPGTFSKLTDVGGELVRGDRLWQSATQLRNGSVSTISWLGYDAPQSLVTEAPFRSYADEGAPALTRFTDGLRTAHTGAPTHMTMVGHSYGSTVIGSAALHDHLAADDMIFAGSPGVEARHARDLNIGAEHVYSQVAPADPVPVGGEATRLPGHIPSGGPFSLGEPSIPGDPEFGGRRLPYGFNPDSDGRNPLSAHGTYWNLNSESLANQAKVIAGAYH
ncbi:alpha/beta hydrolase [Actinomadura roseirufa]|uniref:alpha/beta hydrolase n=1 Tax=Actinomadura roseirufa TaxID=2094049 RepID=UPI0013F15E02|nr:alpha/beta hydrolase [Actinomadura roseirufa]